MPPILCLLIAAAAAQQSVPLVTAPLALPAPAPLIQNAPDSAPWHLDKALGLPVWLEVGGHQRTRYESFDENFRAGRMGSGQGIFTRTAVHATVRYDQHRATLELLDSRQFDTPSDLALNNGVVNTLDILQASVGTRLTGVWSAGDQLDLTFGRHTMNVGSRRLVARNRFRNTINAFTGVNAQWKNEAGDGVRAFYVLPVQRLPQLSANLRDNDQDFDEERSQVQFFGVHAEKKGLAGAVNGELYALGLDEEDGNNLATRNRDLWTVGTRLVKPPKAGELDFEFEFVHQTGESRSSRGAGNTTDLDHDAQFAHISAGYLWDGSLSPRLEFLFDYASGDDNPNDGENNRFDTLFGARRFEFGPTGIFGAFARSNLVSPGLRLNLKPTKNTQVMVANRYHYLASSRDAWTTSGLVDPTGNSGDHIGSLAEIRVRWAAHPNFKVECGLAHLFAGSFIDNAPNATTQGDSTYSYVMTTFSF